MGSRHLSLRISEELYERLEERASLLERNAGLSDLARTLIEEGLRMEEHPGIYFNPGPTGRRAHLMRGPDVWELVNVYQQVKEPGVDAIARTAEELGIHKNWVEVGLRYYAQYTEEIDKRIASNREHAERAYAKWLREQEIMAQ